VRPALAFFSFAELTDPSKHHEFNEYHQLDHRPENLALPGVTFGERWVRSPDVAALFPTPPTEFAGIHYVTMYWLREPVAATRLEWMDFGTTATHLGRRPDLGWSTRPLVAPFVPLKGYVNPRVLISAEALPWRPARGIFVTVGRLDGDLEAAERLARWYDRVHVPDVLGCAGVAGAWTFVSETAYPARPQAGREGDAPVRIHVYFLDGDLGQFADDLQHRVEAPGADVAAAETPLFASLLRPIVPWEWDWFDGGNGSTGGRA
jgi:hypothetical protein